MSGLRIVPVTPLGHGSDCAICATVGKDVAFFWSRVKKDGPLGCWQWTGDRDTHGYGLIADSKLPRYASARCRGGRLHRVPAHRFAYELLVGPIPDGLTLDHLCHTNDPTCVDWRECPHHSCVNPAHLEPVTMKENVLRGRGLTAVLARQTHCKQGHPLPAPDRRGERICRACKRASDRLHYPARCSYRNRRPATRRADEPDLAGGLWEAAASRDADRQPAGSPDSIPTSPRGVVAG